MADTYLTLTGEENQLEEVEATVISTGVGSAGDIIALNEEGKLDSSIVVGSEGAALEMVAFEDMLAGDFVNIFDDSGTTSARLANASTNFAQGFIRADVLTGETAIVYTQGINSFVTGLTLAANYFLSDTVAGGVTTTIPTAAGSAVQRLGKAVATNQLLFDPLQPIIRS